MKRQMLMLLLWLYRPFKAAWRQRKARRLALQARWLTQLDGWLSRLDGCQSCRTGIQRGERVLDRTWLLAVVGDRAPLGFVGLILQ